MGGEEEQEEGGGDGKGRGESEGRAEERGWVEEQEGAYKILNEYSNLPSKATNCQTSLSFRTDSINILQRSLRFRILERAH